jgi:replicative DNA helicase
VTAAIPPHDDACEEAILGACLLDCAIVDDLGLVPEDFYKSAHAKIFKAIRDLVERGKTADLITVVDELRTQGSLEACGGVAFVSKFTPRTLPTTPRR